MSYYVKKKACDSEVERKASDKLEYNWQANCKGVGERAVTLLDAGKWTDCSFAVGEKGKIISAHRLILASASPVFEAMFFGPLAETKFPIVIPDVEPDVFKEMLYYITTNQVNITSVTFACELHYTAKKYILPHLISLCSYCLRQHVEPRTACFLLEYAILVDDLALLAQCIKILKMNTSEVLCANTLEDARLETVKFLFSLEPLGIQSELELYRAAEKYARAQDKKQVLPAAQVIDITDDVKPSTSKAQVIELISDSDSDTPSKDSSDDLADLTVRKRKRCSVEEKTTVAWIGGTKQDSPVRQLLHLIRFLAMSPQEFAECKRLDFLLTTSEKHALLMNICSQRTPIAMPKGFSQSRVQRTMAIKSTSTLEHSSITVEKDKARIQAVSVVTINSFTTMKSYYSMPFYVLGMPWRVVARPEYVSVNECKIKYLSVSIECNWESTSAWKCKADVEIRMLSQVPRVNSHVHKFNALFSHECPSRGYRTFVAWDDVMSLGFVRYDALSLQVTVNQDIVDLLLNKAVFDHLGIQTPRWDPPFSTPMDGSTADLPF